jgi:hypothetical protein
VFLSNTFSQDGDKFWKIPECYIRGNSIKYLRIPEEIIDLVAVEEQKDRKLKLTIELFSTILRCITVPLHIKCTDPFISFIESKLFETYSCIKFHSNNTVDHRQLMIIIDLTKKNYITDD